MLEKAKIVRKNQIEHTRNELMLLLSISHDFIISLRANFKDNCNLYFVLDFAIGGELWTHMRKRPGMKESDVRFYAGQMALAIEYLQDRDITHRDLKTENILIDHSGYLKLADFGFAKRVPHRTYTVCGTSEYMAPEIIKEGKLHRAGLGLGEGYSKLVDWWAFGILVFEMANHRPPFRHKDKLTLYELILACDITYPPSFSEHLVDLLRNLLVTDPSTRFSAPDVLSHPFFRPQPWPEIVSKTVKPPYIPAFASEGDASHFTAVTEEPIGVAESEQYPELFAEF